MSTTDALTDCGCCENQQALRTEIVEQKKLAGNYRTLHAKAKSRAEKAQQELHEFKHKNKDVTGLLGKIKCLEGRLSALGIQSSMNPLRRIGEENKRLKKQVKELVRRKKELEAQIGSLEEEREKLRTQVARLTRSLYGNESRRGNSEEGRRGGSSARKGKGNKERKKGNSRTKREGLEETVENMEVSACCEQCGKPFVSNGWEESSTIEVEVKAHRRIIRRQRVRGRCECSGGREVVAEAPKRLFPHSEYGNGVWGMYQRFSRHQTLCGVAKWFEELGVRVPKGTLGSRDRAFLDMFRPMGEAYEACFGEREYEGVALAVRKP